MATSAQAAAPQSGRPSRMLTYSEPQRAFMEFATLPWTSPLLLSAPRGDGHPVMILPGFMTSDRSTRVLRRFLRRLGYSVYRWELGRNLGPRAIGYDGELLRERLEAIYDAHHSERVSLVGWSLGGTMARHLSERMPEIVRQVITLGSPLRGSPKSTTVWKVYEAATGQKVTSEQVKRQMDEVAAPPAVPTTAIYSKGDGIVPWENCCVTESAQSENLQVYGSHCGLGVNGTVLYAVADRLAQTENGWQPFAPKGMSCAFFPKTSGRA